MIRIGIVGCGRILNAHLQGYLQLRRLGIDTFRITALCARRVEDALMFRKRGEGPPPRPPVLDPSTGDPLAAPHTYVSDIHDDVEVAIYTDYRDLIASGRVDAINDLTTLAMHHQVGLAAIDAGLHLLTQKPLAISVRAAKRMVAAARARGITFGVFENVRQARSVRAMAWAVRQGLIGEPQISVMGFLGGLWSPDRVVAETPWRHQKLLGGGGGSIDIGVHQMHVQRYVIGEIAAISAVARTFAPVRYLRDTQGNVVDQVKADVDDTYMATLQFERGAIGQLWWSWAGSPEELTISGAPAIIGSHGVIRDGRIITANGERLPLDETFEQQMTPSEREQFFPLGLTDPCAIQNLDWLRAIERGADPETSGEEGLRDLACAFAILESSVLGRTVTLHEVLDGAVDTYQRDIDEHYGLLP
jgi:1,5-anhydro-D-fructose reductase (1,5-anhydro-D-mannitol-forming)